MHPALPHPGPYPDPHQLLDHASAAVVDEDDAEQAAGAQPAPAGLRAACTCGHWRGRTRHTGQHAAARAILEWWQEHALLILAQADATWPQWLARNLHNLQAIVDAATSGDYKEAQELLTAMADAVGDVYLQLHRRLELINGLLQHQLTQVASSRHRTGN